MNVNIMIIDDSKIDLFVSQKIIEKVNSNCKIKPFSSANAALDFLKNLEDESRQAMFIPDVIFLDINMPEMNGFEFLKEFNKLKNVSKKNIKIYMLSSSNNSQDIKKAESSDNCVGFVNKPLTTASLDTIIVRYRPYLEEFDYQAEDVNLKRKVKLVG